MKRRALQVVLGFETGSKTNDTTRCVKNNRFTLQCQLAIQTTGR